MRKYRAVPDRALKLHRVFRARVPKPVLAGIAVVLMLVPVQGAVGAGYTDSAGVAGVASVATVTLPGLEVEAQRDGTGETAVTWNAPTVRPDTAPSYTVERTIGAGDNAETVTLTPAISTQGGSTGFTDDLAVSVTIEGKPISQVATGAFHSCAVSQDGNAYCWGSGSFGQLGNGIDSESKVPAPVGGVLANQKVTQLATGSYHTCAVTEEGRAYCWGMNDYGQLGNGNESDSNMPVLVQGLPNDKTAIRIATGSNFSCALTEDGRAYCWGNGASGRLGNGDTADSNVPVAVNDAAFGGSKVTQIAGGLAHACAVTDNGRAYCWGNGASGGLGNGGPADSDVPVAVKDTTFGAFKVTQIAAGSNHSCAVTEDGGAYCWGGNNYGALGNATNTSSLEPVAVDNDSLGNAEVTQISAGSQYSCASTASNGAYCWGFYGFGQLGTSGELDSNLPLKVGGYLIEQSIMQVSAGQHHSCAVTATGKAYCWGNGDQGRLGNGTSSTYHMPVAVSTQGALGERSCSTGWNFQGESANGATHCVPDETLPVSYSLGYSLSGWTSPTTSATASFTVGP